MKEILNHLTSYKSLDRGLAKEVLINLAKGQYNHSQIAAFLTVFTMRSVTVEELAGFKDAMLELCIQLPLDGYDAIDLRHQQRKLACRTSAETLPPTRTRHSAITLMGPARDAASPAA